MTFSVLKSLAEAKRPVIIVGAGVRARFDEIAWLSEWLDAPIAPTWGALDGFPSDSPLNIGSFGTHGTRAGNFAVANADYILAIGTRLDSKATGTPIDSFARCAQILMVDIDEAEIRKFSQSLPRLQGIVSDAADFLRLLTSTGVRPADHSDWIERIEKWKRDYPMPDLPPYRIIRDISDSCAEGQIIVADTGCTIAWTCQAWRFKRGQRLLHAWNQTPMGYALPAAIGAHYATGKPVIALVGDGSIMMSLAELATIAQRKLPIEIHVFNNGGHAMCRQTQREWLGSEYHATSIEGGLTFPDFSRIARAFGVAMTVHNIPPDCDVVPKVRFGRPNEDGDPLLSRDEFCSQMIIAPHQSSI